MRSSTRIADIKSDISVEEVVLELGGSVPYGGGGWSEWQPVNCPFHDDRNASAAMNQSLGKFKCHACDAPREGQAGDIIDMAKYHLQTDSITEAIDWLRETLR